MKDIKFKDIAHLYLGCELIAITDFDELEDYEYKKGDRVKLVLINKGRVQIHAMGDNENWRYGIDLEDFWIADWDLNGFKPILRRLYDITDEECKERAWGDKEGFYDYMKYSSPHPAYTEQARWYPDDFAWLLSKGFDMFNLIESGQAIDKSTL